MNSNPKVPFHTVHAHTPELIAQTGQILVSGEGGTSPVGRGLVVIVTSNLPTCVLTMLALISSIMSCATVVIKKNIYTADLFSRWVAIELTACQTRFVPSVLAAKHFVRPLLNYI